MGYVLHELIHWQLKFVSPTALINVEHSYYTKTLYQILTQISFSAPCTSCKCK